MRSPLPTASALIAELHRQLASPFTGEELFDCLPDLVFFLKNVRGEYVVVNQTLVERCGLPNKQALLGRTPVDVFPHPLGASYRAQDEHLLRTGTPILQQLELHLSPKGREGWCLTNKLPLRARDGSICGLMGVSQDLSSRDAPPETAGLADVLRFVQSHCHQNLKVPELAARANLSAYQLDQRIRKLWGISAGQWIHKTRMEEAVRLLRSTAQPIAQVALAVGYGDQSAFARQFKLTVGLSPGQFRQVVRAGLVADAD